jgi:hypothetical protein
MIRATARAAANEDRSMYEGVDTVVLHNELAYHDTLPLEWEPRPQAFDAFELASLEEANALLLQACVSVEEHPVRDKNEELTPLASELARLDFKLNLVLQLLGSMSGRGQTAVAAALRFNALGASWTANGAAPAPGARGLLKIRLRGSLPQTLNFPAEIVRVEGLEVSARYLQLSEPVAELIQRLCFLQHRKQVADARKSRKA